MGSTHKKKKGTTDVNTVVADIKDEAELVAIRTVLQTGLELISASNPRMPFIRNSIDYVNVTETIGPSQTPS